jgi:hypothetical protein
VKEEKSQVKSEAIGAFYRDRLAGGRWSEDQPLTCINLLPPKPVYLKAVQRKKN